MILHFEYDENIVLWGEFMFLLGDIQLGSSQHIWSYEELPILHESWKC